MDKAGKKVIFGVRAAVKDMETYQGVSAAAKTEANLLRTSSKRAIALIRKKGSLSAEEQFIKASKALGGLTALLKKKRALSREGYFREALEEHVEALILRAVLGGKAWGKDIGGLFEPDIFLSAAADSTGELVRIAISMPWGDISKKKIKMFLEFSDSVSRELLPVAHSGKLRQKHDETERNIQRLERILSEFDGE